MENKIVAKFVVFMNNQMISNFDLKESQSIVIGRGNEASYQIKSGALSRRHCQIVATPNGIVVNDCGSLNGTYINFVQIAKPTYLNNKDQIQLGPIAVHAEILINEQKLPTPSTKPIHNQKNVTIPPTHVNPLYMGENVENTNVPGMTFSPKISTGPCLSCGRQLSVKDMKCQLGIYRNAEIYCTDCFIKGVGNFPTIHNFRIVKKLGSGGMGDVFEAVQLSMQRIVAFKLMKGLENASDQQIQRFFREAHTGGKLNHPNIVGFIDAGNVEKVYYIAMELVTGTDVRKVLEANGPIHYREAMRIAYYVAKALEYAYSKYSIVHRDVKPENILIDTDQIVKLTDFGLAKNLEEAGLSGITKSQTGVGTLFYMSPEQIADARFADQRADIYSLGVTMYEMITNEKPFFATQMMQLVNKIRNSVPRPIKEIVPDVPDMVCHIITKAMTKDANDRFQSAKEMMQVVKQYVQEEI